MSNQALNRTSVVILTNKSGGDLTKGAVVITGTATAKAVTTTTSSGYKSSNIGVLLENIANNAAGMVALGQWVPKINLASSASLYDFIKCHTVAGQGTPHAAPSQAGDFAIALETGTTPSAFLFGIPYPASFDPSALDITGTFALSGDISPSQITSNQNDYSPTGLSTATVLRLNSDASRNITGLAGGADGRIITIYNTGSTDIVLKNNDSNSSAANRFKLQADITLVGGDGCILIYDSTASFWRCIGKTPGGSGGITDAASDSNPYVRLNAAWAGMWTQVINESGASYANFTTGSGTWASDGTQIKQTDTGATERKAKYNTKVNNSILIFEAQIRIHTSTAENRGGLIVSNGSAGMVVYLKESADAVFVDNEGVTSRANFASTIALDTYYKLRLIIAGNAVSIYFDGTLIGTAVNAPTTYDITSLYLYSYSSEVWFKNIKAWTLAFPA